MHKFICNTELKPNSLIFIITTTEPQFDQNTDNTNDEYKIVVNQITQVFYIIDKRTNILQKTCNIYA